MKPSQIALALLLTASLGGALSACQKPAGGAPEAAARTITVSGEGFVEAKPDLAVVTVGVVTQGATAADALALNTKRMAGLFDLIKGLGIEPKDVQTSSLSVSPRYTVSDPTKPGGDSVIAGYDAHNDVTVRVRDLAKLGDVLDKFVSVAGANNLGGVSFDFAEPDPLLDTARKNAIGDAKRKAALYAEAAGVKLGPLQSVGESGSFYPKQSYAMAARVMAAPAPVAAGESRVTANVSLTFGIE